MIEKTLLFFLSNSHLNDHKMIKKQHPNFLTNNEISFKKT